MICELVINEFHDTNKSCSLGCHDSLDFGLDSHNLHCDGRHWEMFSHILGPLKSPFQQLIRTYFVGEKVVRT